MATVPKPEKPSPDFPLFSHARGVWAKKIGGKMRYFGKWSDPAEALRKYNAYVSGDAEQGSQPNKVVAIDGKPAKPHPDFPLFPHASKQWAKKILGKTYYFGHWDEPQAALEKFLEQKDDLLAGRKPAINAGAVDVRFVVNHFLAHKESLKDSNELAARSFDDYYKECSRVIDVVGRTRSVVSLGPDDFELLRKDMAKTLGPVALGNAINRVRILFKYAADQKLIPSPVHFGQSFKRPTAKTLRRERQKKGKRLFEAKQITSMLGIATKSMKAMILLGINAGFGNSDCATLPISALDLQGGWVDYPRPKTGVSRRCKLWPETVAALNDVLQARKEPKNPDHSSLVFITRTGDSWSGDMASITKECDKLLEALNIKRPGLAFYALRHTHQTVGEKSLDAAAVQFIMGHVPLSNDMSSVYREEVDDERLVAVSDCLHRWLYGS